jgi:hypothetical protein
MTLAIVELSLVLADGLLPPSDTPSDQVREEFLLVVSRHHGDATPIISQNVIARECFLGQNEKSRPFSGRPTAP